MTDKLEVYLWGKRVGTLVACKERCVPRIYFRLDEEFALNGYDINPLQMPIGKAATQTGLSVHSNEEKLFDGLPSFIADSLPGNWGSRVFKVWAKDNKIKMRDLTTLDKLAYLGRRGMGALEFVPPTDEDMETPFKTKIESLYELSKTALPDTKRLKSRKRPDLMIESLFKVGTSAGGSSPKAVINYNLKTGRCLSGQVAGTARSVTPMIIKFDENLDIPTTQIEYAYYLMACDAGLKMMPSSLLKDGDSTHFLTKRFDRRGRKKIHVQTLAAMRPNADSYEDLFDVARSLRIKADERRQLFVQMTLNVLTENVDDHSRNFSFLMGQDGVWHVSPAYDFTFSVDLSAADYANRHRMSINGKKSGIKRDDLMEIAGKYSICQANALIYNILSVVRNFKSYAQVAGLDEWWTRKIQEAIDIRVETSGCRTFPRL